MARCRIRRRRATLRGDRFTQFWTTSKRLKIGRSAVRPRPWPPTRPLVRGLLTCGFAVPRSVL